MTPPRVIPDAPSRCHRPRTWLLAALGATAAASWAMGGDRTPTHPVMVAGSTSTPVVYLAATDD